MLSFLPVKKMSQVEPRSTVRAQKSVEPRRELSSWTFATKIVRMAVLANLTVTPEDNPTEYEASSFILNGGRWGLGKCPWN